MADAWDNPDSPDAAPPPADVDNEFAPSDRANGVVPLGPGFGTGEAENDNFRFRLIPPAVEPGVDPPPPAPIDPLIVTAGISPLPPDPAMTSGGTLPPRRRAMRTESFSRASSSVFFSP